MSESVFEVVDTTDEDMYFTMGVFLTLNAATKALNECTPKNMPSDYDHDDFCRIEIRERRFGWSGIGKTVQVREWKQTVKPKENQN